MRAGPEPRVLIRRAVPLGVRRASFRLLPGYPQRRQLGAQAQHLRAHRRHHPAGRIRAKLRRRNRRRRRRRRRPAGTRRRSVTGRRRRSARRADVGPASQPTRGVPREVFRDDDRVGVGRRIVLRSNRRLRVRRRLLGGRGRDAGLRGGRGSPRHRDGHDRVVASDSSGGARSRSTERHVGVDRWFAKPPPLALPMLLPLLLHQPLLLHLPLARPPSRGDPAGLPGVEPRSAVSLDDRAART
mmetsp:Transcript_608/g.2147  ORF Transcript_608/g.2147 Transcript_608/m.2147 type:complete len:242 (-) Transcript_608:491-1216(-)